MRTFYIFRINKEMEVLLKDNPYNLFKSLVKNIKTLFKLSNKDVSTVTNNK